MKNNLQLAKTAQYEWKPDAWVNATHRVNIKDVVSELKEIEKHYGYISAQNVLENSKNKNSVLHDYFEWDDERAANSWRITQARLILSAIQVTVIKSGKPVRMRAYQVTKKSGPKIGESSYVKFNAITQNDLVYIQQTALRLLVGAKNKLEANELVTALPHIEKAIIALQKSMGIEDST